MIAANAPACIVCTSSSSSSHSQLYMYERKGNKRTTYIKSGFLGMCLSYREYVGIGIVKRHGIKSNTFCPSLGEEVSW